MKQYEIDEITHKILVLNNDKEKIHEFICSLANAKAIIENKLDGELRKTVIKASMKSFISNLTKG